MVQVNIAVRKTGVAEYLVGKGCDSFLSHLHRSFITARPMRGNAPQETGGVGILPSRISLIPQLESLVRFFQIPRHLPVVSKVDEKSLAITDSIPHLPGFCGAL